MRTVFFVNVRNFTVMLTVLLFSSTTSEAAAATLNSLRDCALIENAGQRLSCYDTLALQSNPPAVPDESAPACPQKSTGEDSYLSKRWDLDESRERGRFTLVPHRDNYLRA
jgi:hypothetical protein